MLRVVGRDVVGRRLVTPVEDAGGCCTVLEDARTHGTAWKQVGLGLDGPFPLGVQGTSLVGATGTPVLVFLGDGRFQVCQPPNGRRATGSSDKHSPGQVCFRLFEAAIGMSLSCLIFPLSVPFLKPKGVSQS